MELWSKGLGSRVLSLALGERTSLSKDDGRLVIEGVMHSPTFWEYRVTLGEDDIIEFLDLLQRPDSLRMMISDKDRLSLFRAAVSGLTGFAIETIRVAISGAPVPETIPELTVVEASNQRGKPDGRS